MRSLVLFCTTVTPSAPQITLFADVSCIKPLPKSSCSHEVGHLLAHKVQWSSDRRRTPTGNTTRPG